MNYLSKVTILFLAVSLMTGCAQAGPPLPGGVDALHPGTAMMIIQDATNGLHQAFTMVRTRPNGVTDIIFARPFQDFWGVVLLSDNPGDMKELVKSGGNALSNKNFTEFIKYAQAQGFTKLDKAPAWMATAFAAVKTTYNQAVHLIYSAGSANVPFFLVLPFSIFEGYPFEVEGVQG